jgi:regulator of RNase E activity RraB
MTAQIRSKKQQREFNPHTLLALLEEGSDLSKTHKINNVFYVFSSDKISEISIKLKLKGFNNIEVMENKEAENIYWSIHAAYSLIPNIRAIDELTDLCCEIADLFDSDYDGWYTQLVM